MTSTVRVWPAGLRLPYLYQVCRSGHTVNVNENAFTAVNKSEIGALQAEKRAKTDLNSNLQIGNISKCFSR